MRFLLPILALALSGCTLLSPQMEKAAVKVQDGVDRYCMEVDETRRSQFREMVNPTPGGASITVTCPQ